MRATLNDVQDALDRQQIAPFFQPIVELRTGHLCGFEVLARWLHPAEGPILPPDFIALAESGGLLGKLTEQILRKAFVSAGAVPGNLFLAVNVSPSELCSGGLIATIRDAAEQAGFNLSRLVVEVTETVVIDDIQRAKATALELNDMGCKLALDDFGTGHSSLSYLQELPFYGFKVDRSFVASMAVQRQSRKIVASVVGLGVSLALRSVAEGVEAQEQADMLLWLGCDMAQGWLYGHPEPADKLPDIVAASFHSARSNERLQEDDVTVLPAQRLAQLRAIYKGVPVGLCFVNTRLRYVSLNQRYADFVGKPMATILGAPVQQILPDVFASIQPLLERALGGESIANEVVLRSATASGVARAALVSYEPVRDEAGEILGISAAVLDVSDQHPERGVQSDTQREDPAEGNLHMPWVRDAHGNLTEVSPQWTAITGMSREQSLNLGSLEALHPDDRTIGLSALREALRTRGPIDVTCRVRAKDGSYRWVRARGYPRYDPSRKFIGWYGGTEDVEETKRLQNALRDQPGEPDKDE